MFFYGFMQLMTVGLHLHEYCVSNKLCKIIFLGHHHGEVCKIFWTNILYHICNAKGSFNCPRTITAQIILKNIQLFSELFLIIEGDMSSIPNCFQVQSMQQNISNTNYLLSEFR